MMHHLAFVRELVKKGGPDSSEYKEFSDWLKTVHTELGNDILNKSDLETIRKELGEALSILTLQGFVYSKPHGYPGDYEIIEKIYLEQTSKNPELRKWDLFFQLQKAPMAVRNRKQYCLNLLNAVDSTHSEASQSRILNIASGPARDLFDFFTLNKDSELIFDNVEFDPLAISYAKNLCKEFLGQINFLHTNAFEYSTDKKYRLIWSAGLFDYLNDKKFVFLLNHVLSLLEEDGEIVVGNFSPDNPTLPYMEIMGDWNLKHRSREQLISLAKACNINDEDIRVGQEPEGVNLFLHIKRGADFINI